MTVHVTYPTTDSLSRLDIFQGERHVVRLTGVHSSDDCAGRACVIHSRSAHHMSDWFLLWRDDRGIFERICAHGIGHPDPDQFAYWEEVGQTSQAVHGCDGCCSR